MQPLKRFFVLALAVGCIAIPAAGFTAVVINEIDYDQPGTDAAEFIELYNTGPGSENLGDYTLEFANGSAGGAIYDTIVLGGVLPAGGYYVVCANAATVTPCDLDDGPDTNFIQNGSPDAVGLRRLGVLVDAVSYEGNTTGYTEGTGTTIADSNNDVGRSIGRSPNGVDTDDNSADFAYKPTTPGAANDAVPGPGPAALGFAAAALLLGGTFFVGRRRTV